MPRLYIYVNEKERGFFEQVARDHGLSTSAFFRQAGLEKALGRPVDKATSEIMTEIHELKSLVQKRDQVSKDASGILTDVAMTPEAGIPTQLIMEKIMSLLAASPPLNLHDVTRAIGFPEKMVFTTLARMVDEGTVVFDDRLFEYKLVK